MTPDSASTDRTGKLLRRLFKGIERRSAMDGAARKEIEAQLLDTLTELILLSRTADPEPGYTIPRPVALAMASALFAQPHLSLFRDMPQAASDGATAAPNPESEPPLVLPLDHLQDVLGLALWELEEMREEIDRHVSAAYKQARAAWWIWTQFHLPKKGSERLYRLLFPAASDPTGPVTWTIRGSQLYVLVPQEFSPPPESLYLSWLAVNDSKTQHPTRSFRAKYADPDLRRAIARAVGASPEEAIAILDRMIVVLPRNGAAGLLAQDIWRTRGYATNTAIPDPAKESAWLTTSLEPADVDIDSWMRRQGDTIGVKDVKAVFDSLALPRVNEALRLLYAWMMTRIDLEDGRVAPAPGVADLSMLDTDRHVRAVLQPVLDWIESPRTAGYVAVHFGTTSAKVTPILEEIADVWRAHMEYAWAGGPKDGAPKSVAVLMTLHLIALQDTLRQAVRRPNDPRAMHRDIVLLFAANYYAQSPLERLLSEASGRAPRALDAVGSHFWSAWAQVLNTGDEITAELG